MRRVGWAYSSAGEHCIDIAGVTSSILVTPTILRKFGLHNSSDQPFVFVVKADPEPDAVFILPDTYSAVFDSYTDRPETPDIFEMK
jgi:hypothetical protein